LHVAGHRGGDATSFRLIRPRYNAARRTVSFKARRLDSKRLPAGAAGTAGIARTRSLFGTSSQTGPSSGFGPSSMTVASHPTVAPAPGLGNECFVEIVNGGPWPLTATTWSAWDTDTWERYPPEVGAPKDTPPWSQGDAVLFGQRGTWVTFGGDVRGCSNKVAFEWQDNPAPGTFIIETTWPWGQGPTSTCNGDQNSAVMYGNGNWKCTRNDHDGQITWTIVSN
jgi:hypothetical protein